MSEYTKLLEERLAAEAKARDEFNNKVAVLRLKCKHKEMTRWLKEDTVGGYTRFVQLCICCHQKIGEGWRYGTWWTLNKEGEWEPL